MSKSIVRDMPHSTTIYPNSRRSGAPVKSSQTTRGLVDYVKTSPAIGGLVEPAKGGRARVVVYYEDTRVGVAMFDDRDIAIGWLTSRPQFDFRVARTSRKTVRYTAATAD